MRTDYNARGYRSGLTDATDSANAVAIETFDAMNAYGQIGQQTYGNGVVTAGPFDAKTGRLTDIDTTRGTAKIQDNTYVWRTNGILASRLDESGATAKQESFGYDALDRLKSATTQLGDLSETMNPAERTLSYAYDKLGNLTGRTSTVAGDRGLSGTSFGDGTAAPGPNALTGAIIGTDAYALAHDAGGKVTSYDRTATGDDTFIGWNGRGLVETIVVGDSADDADPTTKETFAYGPDGRRYHRESVWNDGGVSRTDHTFYAGAVEERLLDGHADYASVQRTGVGGGIVQVRTLSHPDAENDDEQTEISNLEYLHRDHLGSIEAVTNASGAELLTLAYDPFGARRKADWTRSLNSSEIETLADDLRTKVSRGYSDHEHLDRAGFVHMNGRVYDPRTGRFLSPDPIVENPAFSQSWNSYSYVANSPLSLVDPTGLSFAPCRPPPWGSAIPNPCMPTGSPGVFGGRVQTILSAIHRVRYRTFVYQRPSVGIVFGDEGFDFVFGVVRAIGVVASVTREIIERRARVDDQGEADEPIGPIARGRWLANDAAEKPDVVGNPDLDRAAIRILDMLEDLRVEQSVAIRVSEEGEYYFGKLRRGTSRSAPLEIYPNSVAGAHTHAPSRSDSINREKELPGRGDHVLVEKGFPNYIKTPRGDIRVLERVDGKFRVRTVRGKDVRGQSTWKPGRRDAFGRRRL